MLVISCLHIPARPYIMLVEHFSLQGHYDAVSLQDVRVDGQLAAGARAAVRAAGGIRVLIGLLSSRAGAPATAPDLRAVAAFCLLGLAQDPALCRILARLQVSACVLSDRL